MPKPKLEYNYTKYPRLYTYTTYNLRKFIILEFLYYGKKTYGLDGFCCAQVHEGTYDKTGESILENGTRHVLNKLSDRGYVKKSLTLSNMFTYSITQKGRKYYKNNLRVSNTITNMTGVFVNYNIWYPVPSVLMSIYRYVKRHAHPDNKNWSLSKEKRLEIYAELRMDYFTEKPYQLIGYADCNGDISQYAHIIEKYGIEIPSNTPIESAPVLRETASHTA